MAYWLQTSARLDLVVRSVEELNQRGASFIRDFERQEPRMVEIAQQMDIIVVAVKAIIAAAEETAKWGAVGAVCVTVAGALAAPFTGGISLAAATGPALTMAAMAISAKVAQSLVESGKAETLERLGNEFMRIARPLSEELKEIKAKAKDLQVDVADYLLSEKLRRIEEALRKLDDASGAIDEALAFMRSLVQLVLQLLQRISTDKEEDELTNRVVKSGEQCWKIIKRFREVKKDLQDFKENMAIC